MDSTAARHWALKKIPTLVRESLLHQIGYYSDCNDNSVVKFWSILYSSQLYNVHVPSELNEKSRQTIMQYLATGLDQQVPLPTLIYKVAGANTAQELEAEAKFLQKASYLTIFVHRKGANDALMGILGNSCPCLQVRSSKN